MIIERTESPRWTSNAYLVADREGGRAIVIDGNGVLEPLIARAHELDIEVAAVIVAHWDDDHIADIDRYRDAFDAPVYAHPWTKEALNGRLAIDRTIDDGAVLAVGGLYLEAWHTPGHTAGQLSMLINGTDVFTADVLFKDTVGGTFAPGSTGFIDHRASVMRLIELDDETRVHPGHTLPSTTGREREHNRFMSGAAWRPITTARTKRGCDSQTTAATASSAARRWPGKAEERPMRTAKGRARDPIAKLGKRLGERLSTPLSAGSARPRRVLAAALAAPRIAWLVEDVDCELRTAAEFADDSRIPKPLEEVFA
jgi:glyoxylase-like metal-dependent hydrolase (beta-lactamase superfamily II)